MSAPAPHRRVARPSGTDQSVSAELNLTHAPSLEVSAGQQPWRSTLTNRHTEILLLLHAAGPAGLRAEQLSRGLYGDTAHGSRYERRYHDCAAHSEHFCRPSPVANGVVITVVLGPTDDAAECAFVQSSKSPGVRALAAGSRVH
jgi:hypothetical protein